MPPFEPKQPTQETLLLDVPSINPNTGISSDFRNEYVAFLGVLTLPNSDPKAEIQSLIKETGFRMRTYEEHFPMTKYRSAVTEENKARVTQINSLVESFNEKITNLDSVSVEELIAICNTLETLVKGE